MMRGGCTHDVSLVSWFNGPDTARGVERAGADGLLDFEGLDMIIVKEIIEAFAVYAVLVVTEVFGAGRRIDLIKISGSQRTKANGGPRIADNVLDIWLFDEQNRSGRIGHDRGFVT